MGPLNSWWTSALTFKSFGKGKHYGNSQCRRSKIVIYSGIYEVRRCASLAQAQLDTTCGLAEGMRLRCHQARVPTLVSDCFRCHKIPYFASQDNWCCSLRAASSELPETWN